MTRPPFVTKTPSFLRRDGIVLLVYSLLALLLTYPLITHLDTHVPGRGVDYPALAWNLWWVKFSVLNLGVSPLYTDYLFYPIGINLVAFTATFLNGMISIPLQFLFGVIVANNLIVYFSLVVCGYGTFLLAREILARHSIHSDFAAALAGAFYAFSAWHINYIAARQFNIFSNEPKAMPIALVPVGQVDESILAVIGEALRETFCRAYVIVASMLHPDYAHDGRRGQYLSDAILAVLRCLDLPAERWLGVVDLDLYTPGLNFVFGQATMGGPTALIALPRLRQSFYGLPEDEALFRQRVAKEAVHELGHTYGLSHCRDARCVMSFSNSLRDVDRKNRSFCPSCRGKLP